MSCEAEKIAFTDALKGAQSQLKNELQQVADDTKARTQKLADDFKNKNDTAKGVGAVAGSVAGGLLGGPEGALVGAEVGEKVGALFTVEVKSQTVKFSMDLPDIQMKNEEWSLDLPQVTTKDEDIIFNVPTMVMKRAEGAPIPHSTTTMVTQCVDMGWPIGKVCTDVPETTVTWEKTYFDVPTWEEREQRIVIGIPEVAMKTQKMVVGVPEISMRTQEFSFDIPLIIIKFVQDASKDLADEANTIAADSATLVAQKQASFKDRMKQQVTGPARAMFGCYRSELLSKRDEVAKFFSTQLDTIANSIITMKSNKVPETDDAYIQVKARADELVKKREEALKNFDDALIKLDKQMQESIDHTLMQ